MVTAPIPASVRTFNLPGILGLCALLCLTSGCSTAEVLPRQTQSESASISAIREVFARIPQTLAKNHKEFAVQGRVMRGFAAGEAYPQIWLRDSAWIVPVAAAYYDADSLISWLDLHLAAAEKNGRLRDWVAASSPDIFREWAPRVSALGPLSVDTNSNESDQEPSAALAYCRIAEAIPGHAAVSGAVHESRVLRLRRSMDALFRDRTDLKTGLIWSGLTADWGDVSPVYPDQRAIYRDASTPRTLSLYSNVMAYAALDCLAGLDGPKAEKLRLAERAVTLRDLIRDRFWLKDRGYFRIRLPFDAAPHGFADDDDRFALGGNALAALLGIADDTQAAAIFETAERLREANGFSTISTTLIPPYVAGVFQHAAMREPFQYQNGGQWDWFGALLVEAEYERGHSALARTHLDQIVARTLKAGPGIHEWYAQDGTPKGSASYAASAAAIHAAIVKGLVGVTRTDLGYRVVLRTSETLLPIEVPQRAASTRLILSLTRTTSAIDITVQGTAPVHEVCAVLPAGAKPQDLRGAAIPAPQATKRIGADTLMCADVSSSTLPLRVSFAVSQ